MEIINNGYKFYASSCKLQIFEIIFYETLKVYLNFINENHLCTFISKIAQLNNIYTNKNIRFKIKINRLLCRKLNNLLLEQLTNIKMNKIVSNNILSACRFFFISLLDENENCNFFLDRNTDKRSFLFMNSNNILENEKEKEVYINHTNADKIKYEGKCELLFQKKEKYETCVVKENDNILHPHSYDSFNNSNASFIIHNTNNSLSSLNINNLNVGREPAYEENNLFYSEHIKNEIKKDSKKENKVVVGRKLEIDEKEEIEEKRDQEKKESYADDLMNKNYAFNEYADNNAENRKKYLQINENIHIKHDENKIVNNKNYYEDIPCMGYSYINNSSGNDTKLGVVENMKNNCSQTIDTLIKNNDNSMLHNNNSSCDLIYKHGNITSDVNTIITNKEKSKIRIIYKSKYNVNIKEYETTNKIKSTIICIKPNDVNKLIDCFLKLNVTIFECSQFIFNHIFKNKKEKLYEDINHDKDIYMWFQNSLNIINLEISVLYQIYNKFQNTTIYIKKKKNFISHTIKVNTNRLKEMDEIKKYLEKYLQDTKKKYELTKVNFEKKEKLNMLGYNNSLNENENKKEKEEEGEGEGEGERKGKGKGGRESERERGEKEGEQEQEQKEQKEKSKANYEEFIEDYDELNSFLDFNLDKSSGMLIENTNIKNNFLNPTKNDVNKINEYAVDEDWLMYIRSLI